MDHTFLDIILLSSIGLIFVAILVIEVQIHQIKVMIEERWINGGNESMSEKYNGKH